MAAFSLYPHHKYVLEVLDSYHNTDHYQNLHTLILKEMLEVYVLGNFF